MTLTASILAASILAAPIAGPSTAPAGTLVELTGAEGSGWLAFDPPELITREYEAGRAFVFSTGCTPGARIVVANFSWDGHKVNVTRHTVTVTGPGPGPAPGPNPPSPTPPDVLPDAYQTIAAATKALPPTIRDAIQPMASNYTAAAARLAALPAETFSRRTEADRLRAQNTAAIPTAIRAHPAYLTWSTALVSAARPYDQASDRDTYIKWLRTVAAAITAP